MHFWGLRVKIVKNHVYLILLISSIIFGFLEFIGLWVAPHCQHAQGRPFQFGSWIMSIAEISLPVLDADQVSTGLDQSFKLPSQPISMIFLTSRLCFVHPLIFSTKWTRCSSLYAIYPYTSENSSSFRSLSPTISGSTYSSGSSFHAFYSWAYFAFLFEAPSSSLLVLYSQLLSLSSYSIPACSSDLTISQGRYSTPFVTFSSTLLVGCRLVLSSLGVAVALSS